MNKKNNLALFTLLVVGLFSSFTSNIFAQKTDSVEIKQSTKTCTDEKFVMPESISVGNETFANYISNFQSYHLHGLYKTDTTFSRRKATNSRDNC